MSRITSGTARTARAAVLTRETYALSVLWIAAATAVAGVSSGWFDLLYAVLALGLFAVLLILHATYRELLRVREAVPELAALIVASAAVPDVPPEVLTQLARAAVAPLHSPVRGTR